MKVQFRVMTPVTAELLTAHSLRQASLSDQRPLCSTESYLTPSQIQEVYRAYVSALKAHEGQQRMTGEPYIYHPLALPGFCQHPDGSQVSDGGDPARCHRGYAGW